MLKSEYTKDLSATAVVEDPPSIQQKKFSRYLAAHHHDSVREKLLALPAAPLPPAVDQHAATRKEYQETIDKYKDEIKNITKQIDDSINLIANFKVFQDFPTFGEADTIDVQQLRLTVPLFDPRMPSDFEILWHKLISFGEGAGLNERMFKMALSNLLQGEAFGIYHRLRDKSLKAIMDALQGSYNDNDTLLDKQDALYRMKRTRGQSIGAFMNNVHSLALQTNALRSPDEKIRQAEVNTILEQQLKQNCSDKASKELRRQTKKSLKNGLRLSYEQLLEIAKSIEHEEETMQV